MRVYIAGPVRIGDRAANIANAIDAGQRVWEAGHTPFIPHLCQAWEERYPGRDLYSLMHYDLMWLAVCDVVVRVPGESTGAELEVAVAMLMGIPVHTLEEFLGGANARI